MTDRPIIFSAPMVRALLREAERPGTGKTQTRRLLKLQPGAMDCVFRDGGGFWHVTDSQCEWISELRIPYAPGDRLWAREAFTTCEKHKFMVAYRADGQCGAWCWDGDGKPMFLHHGRVVEASPLGQWGFARYGGRWRPSIHMPRWASRLTLTVTDVRVQRLQDISEADAVAEGCIPDNSSLNPNYIGPARSMYEALWNSLHGPDAWDANPWVAAISFTVEKRNIDEARK